MNVLWRVVLVVVGISIKTENRDENPKHTPEPSVVWTANGELETRNTCCDFFVDIRFCGFRAVNCQLPSLDEDDDDDGFDEDDVMILSVLFEEPLKN